MRTPRRLFEGKKNDHVHLVDKLRIYKATGVALEKHATTEWAAGPEYDTVGN